MAKLPRPKSQAGIGYVSSQPLKTSPAGDKPGELSGHVWVHESRDGPIGDDESEWHWALYALPPEAEEEKKQK